MGSSRSLGIERDLDHMLPPRSEHLRELLRLGRIDDLVEDPCLAATRKQRFVVEDVFGRPQMMVGCMPWRQRIAHDAEQPEVRVGRGAEGRRVDELHRRWRC